MSEYEFDTVPLILQSRGAPVYTTEEALAWRYVAEVLADALMNTAKNRSYLGWFDAYKMYENLKSQYIDREVEYLDYETGEKA